MEAKMISTVGDLLEKLQEISVDNDVVVGAIDAETEEGRYFKITLVDDEEDGNPTVIHIDPSPFSL